MKTQMSKYLEDYRFKERDFKMLVRALAGAVVEKRMYRYVIGTTGYYPVDCMELSEIIFKACGICEDTLEYPEDFTNKVCYLESEILKRYDSYQEQENDNGYAMLKVADEIYNDVLPFLAEETVSIEELQLPTRAKNSLRRANIVTIGALKQKIINGDIKRVSGLHKRGIENIIHSISVYDAQSTSDEP